MCSRTIDAYGARSTSLGFLKLRHHHQELTRFSAVTGMICAMVEPALIGCRCDAVDCDQAFGFLGYDGLTRIAGQLRHYNDGVDT
jgi:hypothetical protein